MVDEVEQVQPQQEPTSVEQPEEKVIEASQQEAQESLQEKNFRQLRESKQRLERERDEYARRLTALEQAQKPVEQREEELHLGADELVEGKHLHSYEKKMKKMEQQLYDTEARLSAAATEARLAVQYPDFNKVVTRENLEALKEQYPELAQSLNSTPDLYAKAVSAYTLVKKMGIQESSLYDADKAAIQKNANKPRPTASIAPQQADTPLSRANAFANGLTPELQKQLYKEMLDSMKNT